MSERQSVAGAYTKIEGHEELCAERYKNIETAITDLKTDVRGSRNVVWGVLVALLGFMAVQLWDGTQDRVARLENVPPAVSPK